jgi:hypothetical protein
MSGSTKIILLMRSLLLLSIILLVGLVLTTDQIFNDKKTDELSDIRVNYSKFTLLLTIIILSVFIIYSGYGILKSF